MTATPLTHRANGYSLLLTAGVRSLDSLECPKSDRTYHPTDRIGVDTRRTMHSQTKTIPSAMGHAQSPTVPTVTRNSSRDASLGVFHPR